MRSERAGYKFILILIIAFLLSLAASCAYASTDQTEYSSSVAKLIINAGKEEPVAISLRKRGGNKSRIVLARVSSGEPDLSGFDPEVVLSGPNGKYTMRFATVEEAEQAAAAMKAQDNVIYAETDGPVVSCSTTIYDHTDYTYHTWAADPMGFPEILDMCGVEASGSVLIAVIDSGVAEHSQILPRIARYGHDYVDNDSDPTNDGTGHGTHVAGIIVDCTPSLAVNLIPIRVLNDSGGGSIANTINAIDEAVEAGCSIINLSLVSKSVSSAFDDAVNRAVSRGVTVVVSAGNDGTDVSTWSPVHLNTNGLIVVGAVSSNGSLASYSNYGSSVDVYAYGTGISSCSVSGSYVNKSGTSMAAPHITAACAILRLLHQVSSPASTEARLKSIAGDGNYPIPQLARMVPSEVGITALQLTLCTGDEIALQPEVYPVLSMMDLVWTSSNESVVSIEDNVLLAEACGEAVLTVRCSQWVFSCNVTVTDSGQQSNYFVFPASLTDLEEEAFMDIAGARVITVGSRVNSIGNRAFAGDGALETVVLPASVGYIGSDAFPDSVAVVVNSGSYAWQWAVDNGQPYIVDMGP